MTVGTCLTDSPASQQLCSMPRLFAHHVGHLYGTALVVDLPVLVAIDPLRRARAAVVLVMRVGLSVQGLMGYGGGVVVILGARALGRVVGAAKGHVKHHG